MQRFGCILNVYVSVIPLVFLGEVRKCRTTGSGFDDLPLIVNVLNWQ